MTPSGTTRGAVRAKWAEPTRIAETATGGEPPAPGSQAGEASGEDVVSAAFGSDLESHVKRADEGGRDGNS